MKISEQVKAAREACQMSQQELAERAGCSIRYVGGVESGEYSNPGVKILGKLGGALGVTFEVQPETGDR